MHISSLNCFLIAHLITASFFYNKEVLTCEFIFNLLITLNALTKHHGMSKEPIGCVFHHLNEIKVNPTSLNLKGYLHWQRSLNIITLIKFLLVNKESWIICYPKIAKFYFAFLFVQSRQRPSTHSTLSLAINSMKSTFLRKLPVNYNTTCYHINKYMCFIPFLLHLLLSHLDTETI